MHAMLVTACSCNCQRSARPSLCSRCGCCLEQRATASCAATTCCAQAAAAAAATPSSCRRRDQCKGSYALHAHHRHSTANNATANKQAIHYHRSGSLHNRCIGALGHMTPFTQHGTAEHEHDSQPVRTQSSKPAANLCFTQGSQPGRLQQRQKPRRAQPEPQHEQGWFRCVSMGTCSTQCAQHSSVHAHQLRPAT